MPEPVVIGIAPIQWKAPLSVHQAAFASELV
jgi:hypothetical protein